MNANELLGKVAAHYLKINLSEEEEGTARFILDCLTAERTASVARAILADNELSELVDIKLPRHFLEGHGLPEEILTYERATYYRSAACDKAARLVANIGDDEEQSLKDLVPIGAGQLLNHPELWVKEASSGLKLIDDHFRWWEQALKGLMEARAVSLEQFTCFVSATSHAISDEGYPVRRALGYSLPELRLPRDTTYFESLNEKTSRHVSRWKSLFATAFRRRACYLVKQTPTQGLLESETLRASYDKVKETSIPPESQPIVDEFIDAESGWNSEAVSLANCEWEDVKPLFDGLKREKFNLGKKTLEFYDDYDSNLLSEDDVDYLQRLIARRTTEAQEEDELFYQSHRLELKENISLKAKWDRFIYGSPIETEDFLAGLAQCLQALFDQDFEAKSKKLTITSDKRLTREIRQLNRDAGLYFSFRYKGLDELLGKTVSWGLGELMNFSEWDAKWKNATKPFKNISKAKAALQIKFFLELEVELSQGTIQNYSKQLIWKFNPNSISSEMHEDWDRLVKHPLVTCSCHREVVSGKGRFQSIDLEDVSTLLPSYDRDRGSLVSVYRKTENIKINWLQNLKESRSFGLIDAGTCSELEELFLQFCKDYEKAITGFAENGVGASKEMLSQLEWFGKLLNAICSRAKGDRNRELLAKPLLQIGAVPVGGGPITSIVAPWHPLRMAGMANKVLQVTGLIRNLITSKSVYFGDTKLYFEELKSELDHPYYPELVLGWIGSTSELLSLSDHYIDYSLHEPPITQNEEYADTNESPNEGTKRVIDILKRYLALYPHEQSNLSIVLYNCDSARLPQAIVEKIQQLHEDDGDLRCQVVLRHREGKKLRELYERIIESSDSDIDSYVASEASSDFMARLRIGIMADEAPPPSEADGPPMDVVYLQDVIARHAQIEWYEESAQPVKWESWVPPRWSKRRPAALDDLKSVVYLSCPVSSKEGWDYQTALTTFIKGDWDGNEGRRLLPARQLDFRDIETSSIFSEVHNLGNWVVNYDELLDRRQLERLGVQIIRYKQTETQGRNMIVSSNSSTSLLKRMVLKRLKDLNLGITDEEYGSLSDSFISEAKIISGDLVLRAAKRGRSASELIGVVLSKYLLEKEIGDGSRCGWYLLDDYATWLGQREQQIADILVLSPEVGADGSKRLDVIISESKYIAYGSLSSKRKESQKQLRQTVERIAKALFGDPGRLDRDIWLSRFSDMLLNGIQFSANNPLDLPDWRRSIREGKCGIYLRGYSHVFVSGPSDCPECSDFSTVAECESSYQEVYSRAKLRDLVLTYHKEGDPKAIRVDVADSDIWTEKNYVEPSSRITITTHVKEAEEEEAETDGTNSDEESSAESSTSREERSEKTQKTENSSDDDSRVTLTEEALECLVANDSKDSETDIKWLKETESRTKGALQQFQLRSKLLDSVLTPNAAILKFQGSSGLTVDQVLRKRSEFLTTHGLNLISVRAEPGVVSLAVARPKRRLLGLKEAWSDWNPDCVNGNVNLLVGVKEEDGSPLLFSPKDNAPHALVAGSTGSGKSVLIQNIILNIALTNTPEQARIVIIDPKQVDYLAFENLPHIEGGIIDDQEVAIQRLNSLVEEMERRYSLLKANRVTNIYNLLKKPDATEKPPILWVIHEEFADWMMMDEYKEAVTNIVSRLGVKARAAGIFLVFAAQRPDATVMPMQLRANLGNRLILKVDSEGTSEIALGEKGAERLLGKGHLCAKLEGEPDLIYAQVPFVSEDEIPVILTMIIK